MQSGSSWLCQSYFLLTAMRLLVAALWARPMSGTRTITPYVKPCLLVVRPPTLAVPASSELTSRGDVASKHVLALAAYHNDAQDRFYLATGLSNPVTETAITLWYTEGVEYGKSRVLWSISTCMNSTCCSVSPLLD